MSKVEKFLFSLNLLLYLFLAIFSYAYVDLNLTLSKNTLVLFFIESLQKIGYYQRPTATIIYLAVLALSFALFIFNLQLFYKSKLSINYLKITAFTSTIVLIFAYPFLSADLFNYMFDTKIILNYHVSPYAFRPLDFPNDEWLRFMRWTHRYSPYGPLWLGISLVPAVLGFGKFILNFLAFKIFIGLFHLINTYLIFQITKKVYPNRSLLLTAVYALNPLFLIEGVANAHNDIVLTAFMLSTIYFLIIGRKTLAAIDFIASVFIKYIPILSSWVFIIFQKDLKKMVLANLIMMTIFTLLFSSLRITVPFVSSGATQVQFQPWYLFWTLPLVSLIPSLMMISASIVLSFGASLRYLPYLYYGDWSHPGTITFMQTVTILPVVITIIIIAPFFKKWLKTK